MTNCGISRWDSPDKINAALKALTEEPIWEVDDDYYENTILKYYDEKCTNSKAIYEEAKEYIPGGVQHNLAFNKPFPVAFRKAEGAYLYDEDGNKYLDFLQAGGPTILGSNYPVIRNAVIELLNECGPVTGLLHDDGAAADRGNGRGDVPDAGQRHRIRHGLPANRPHRYRKQAHH